MTILGQLLCALELTHAHCKTELNWVELGAVWWQIHKLDTSCLENEFDLLAPMYGGVIQHKHAGALSRVAMHVRKLFIGLV